RSCGPATGIAAETSRPRPDKHAPARAGRAHKAATLKPRRADAPENGTASFDNYGRGVDPSEAQHRTLSAPDARRRRRARAARIGTPPHRDRTPHRGARRTLLSGQPIVRYEQILSWLGRQDSQPWRAARGKNRRIPWVSGRSGSQGGTAPRPRSSAAPGAVPFEVIGQSRERRVAVAGEDDSRVALAGVAPERPAEAPRLRELEAVEPPLEPGEADVRRHRDAEDDDRHAPPSRPDRASRARAPWPPRSGRPCRRRPEPTSSSASRASSLSCSRPVQSATMRQFCLRRFTRLARPSVRG